jgi:hypothetical protein
MGNCFFDVDFVATASFSFVFDVERDGLADA